MPEVVRNLTESVSKALNVVVRYCLGGRASQAERAAFKVKARPMGLRSGIDPTSFNKLAGELELAEYEKCTKKNLMN